MADNRPPLPSSASFSNEPYGDPFADRPRQTRFQEPEGSPYEATTLGPLPRPYQSTTSLSVADNFDDDETIEKQPLTVGQNFSGGFYPPRYVQSSQTIPAFSVPSVQH